VPRSSPGSAPRLLELDPSLYVNIWWALLHAVLAFSALLLDLAPIPAAFALASIAAHAIVRHPRTPRLLVLQCDGTWAVPERGWHGLRLAPGTSWTTWYVELVFDTPAGARIVVLKDQLDAEGWRALQLAVREHDAGAPSADGP
jgi:hypothetical protein